MNHPVSNESKTQVIELWLKGEPYATISAKTSVSTGKISHIISNEFLPALGDRIAAEHLKQLVIEVRAAGITMSQCAIGLHISRLLNDLGLSTDSLENLRAFLDKICGSYTRLAASDSDLQISPDRIIELAGQVLQLLQNSNIDITPAEVPEYVQGKIQEKRELENQIEKLEQECKDRQRELIELFEKQRVASANLEQYVFLREELQKQGLEGEKAIEGTANTIKNAHTMQYSATKIIDQISKIESLKDTKSKLELENKDLREEIRQLSENRRTLQNTVNTFSQTADEIRELYSRGITLNELQELSRILYEIANTRSETSSYTTQQAVSKFFKDIKEQYSKVLSFEEKLKELQEQIDEKGSKLHALELEYSHEKSILDTYKALLSRNISHVDILNWSSILARHSGDNAESRVNTKTLQDDLEKYGGMKATLSKLDNEIRDSESQLGSLLDTIATREIKKGSLEKQIDDVLSKLKDGADLAKTTVRLTTDESLKNISAVTDEIKKSLEFNRQLLEQSYKIGAESVRMVANLNVEISNQMISISKLEGFKDLAEAIRLIELIEQKEGEALRPQPELFSQLEMHLVRILTMIKFVFDRFGPRAQPFIAKLSNIQSELLIDLTYHSAQAHAMQQSKVSQQQDHAVKSGEATTKEDRMDSASPSTNH